MFEGRSNYGAWLITIFNGIRRLLLTVAMLAARSILKAGNEVMKDGVYLKDNLKQKLKGTVGSLLGEIALQLANRLTADQPTTEPKPGPINTYTDPQFRTET